VTPRNSPRLSTRIKRYWDSEEDRLIILDNALKALAEKGTPIRVGLIGAGFMAHGLTNMIANSVPGMRVVAIYNRKPERALDAFAYAGCSPASEATSQSQLDSAIRSGRPVATGDVFLLTRSDQIDILVDTTGAVDFGAEVVLDAIDNEKDVILMNAEIDATIGPILHSYAAKKGVILSACEGDEPAVQMNLYRWVKGLGLTPRVLGSIKGLQDPYRTPTTQKGYAERWGQNPTMVTSFADGSKTSFEQAIVANATGFVARTRGLSRGKEFREDVKLMGKVYDLEELRRLGGVVDYLVGTPYTKVYCLAEHPDPKQQHYLNLYHMGEGPLYSFFVPYHLVHFEVPNSIARVVCFRDSVAPPLGGPVVEVCSVAKRDLRAGEDLDDYGMYMTYGEAVSSDEMSEQRYLPEALAKGCRLLRDIPKDGTISYGDVELPRGRLADRLRAEQYKLFRGESWLGDLLA
jgi:predicted homoserine dehydrogenase-like protein